MNNIVYIEKDERNAVALCRDNYHGIVVQVIRFSDQRVPTGPDMSQTIVKRANVVKSIDVKISPNVDPHTSGNTQPFKARVNHSISIAKEYLGRLKKKDQEIDGVLNDYLSQNKGLNEDGTK